MKWAWERGEQMRDSCPTSISAATPPTRWACRSIGWSCGIRTRSGGGLDAGAGEAARSMILWKGHCSVHTRFTVRADRARSAKQHPGVRVIVHPEVHARTSCRRPTTQRIDRVHHQRRSRRARPDPSGRSAPRSTWSTGSRDEVAPGPHRASSLDQFGCLCSTMFRVSPNHLLWVLEGLLDGEVHNRIVVPDETEALDEGRARSDAPRSIDRPLNCDPGSYDSIRRVSMAHSRFRRFRMHPTALEPHIDEQTMRDPSRQASQRVRDEPERGAREASRAAVEERRGSAARASTPCPRTSAPRCATTAAAT